MFIEILGAHLPGCPVGPVSTLMPEGSRPNSLASPRWPLGQGGRAEALGERMRPGQPLPPEIRAALEVEAALSLQPGSGVEALQEALSRLQEREMKAVRWGCCLCLGHLSAWHSLGSTIWFPCARTTGSAWAAAFS